MRELYSTGVPVPFECYYACQVENASAVEKDLHLAFGDLRVNPNREFFKLTPDKVHAILKHLQINEWPLEDCLGSPTIIHFNRHLIGLSMENF